MPTTKHHLERLGSGSSSAAIQNETRSLSRASAAEQACCDKPHGLLQQRHRPAGLESKRAGNRVVNDRQRSPTIRPVIRTSSNPSSPPSI